MRAGAICMVVAGHMTAIIPAGGAHLLFGLSGHAFSRFVLPMPGGIQTWTSRIGRIALPTMAWIAALMLFEGTHSPESLLLVNNYLGDSAFSGRRWEYWYVEALVQMLVVLALVSAIPAVRRLNRRHPFGLAMGALVAAVAVRELLPTGATETALFRPHVVAWVFVLGWVVHRATGTRQRIVATGAIIATVMGSLGDPSRAFTVAAGLIALTWVPHVRLPHASKRILGAVATGSLAIYLTHWQVWPFLERFASTPVAFVVTIAIGVLAGRLAASAWSTARTALRARGYERSLRMPVRRSSSG